ncbi:hypothetical protein ES703_38496 [subsurface metagenome]
MNVDEFLDRLCGYCATTRIWRALHEGGGAYRFTDIKQFTGASSSTLTYVLYNLLADDLVRKVNHKYQAITPEEMRSPA